MVRTLTAVFVAAVLGLGPSICMLLPQLAEQFAAENHHSCCRKASCFSNCPYARLKASVTPATPAKAAPPAEPVVVVANSPDFFSQVGSAPSESPVYRDLYLRNRVLLI
jgi:hypothetical protein